MDSKSIFASKTLWLNVLGPVFTFLAAHGLDLTPDQQLAAVGIVMGVANIVVRFFTKQPVHVTAPPAALVAGIATGIALTALAACAQLGLTGNPTADAPKLFADACYGLDTANGMFQADSAVFIAAGKLTQAQVAQETAIYGVAHHECVAPPVEVNASGTPVLDANGNQIVDYQRLAIDVANAAAAIYLIISPATAGSPAAAIITHRR